MMIMKSRNLQTNEYDIQAMMYQIICSFAHIMNNTVVAKTINSAFPGSVLTNLRYIYNKV